MMSFKDLWLHDDKNQKVPKEFEPVLGGHQKQETLKPPHPPTSYNKDMILKAHNHGSQTLKT
jgi:hypothetical protein